MGGLAVVLKRWAENRKLRYISVAATCAVINNISVIALLLLGFGPVGASVIGFIPMFFIGYGLHVGVTFRVAPSWSGFARFSVGLAASLPLSIALLYVFVDLFGTPLALAPPLVTVLIFIYNYVATHIAILRGARLASVRGERV